MRATVTSKGQITIPAPVRQRLGLVAGSRVDFVWRSDDVVELTAAAGSVRDLREMLRAERPVTIEEMAEAAAAGAAGEP